MEASTEGESPSPHRAAKPRPTVGLRLWHNQLAAAPMFRNDSRSANISRASFINMRKGNQDGLKS